MDSSRAANCQHHFYPRSPCGERQPTTGILGFNPLISIHALLAESDDKSNKLAEKKLVFLSTLSLRRATINGLRHKCASFYFYPRSPCGERPEQKS